MTDLPAIGNLLVGGGVSTVLVALIMGLFARSTRRGDYAHRIIEASGNFTDRADRRNATLEARLAEHETAMDRLKERLWKFANLMRLAIPVLEAAGHNALAQRMQAAIDSWTSSDDAP
ncbi:hypothetical protein [Nocardia abscessus]|uniref:hypothetical protein n=1 Tax=Nocardia abscessus TaxID=120957 RepID=UPI0024561E1A|nr:hypothetical protein [Nocardia abscessus]